MRHNYVVSCRDIGPRGTYSQFTIDVRARDAAHARKLVTRHYQLHRYGGIKGTVVIDGAKRGKEIP